MKHLLAGIIGQRETSVITAVVDEITAKPRESYGLKLLPPTNVPAHLIYHEKVSGFGGLLSERVYNEEGKNSNGGSSETFEFSGGQYQESVRFNEQDLLTLRALGSMGERGATGVTKGALDRLSRAAQNLQVKLENRLNKIAWDVLFSGVYMFQGIAKANFAFPLANTFQTATDWSTANPTPLKDLYDLQMTHAKFRKYKILEWVMNPITAAAMLNSPEVRAVLVNHAGARGDINAVRQILYPELAPIKVVADSYQDQISTAGVITHADAQYFVPDWKILAIPDFSGLLYGLYGEIQMNYNLNDPTATIEKPATGIYTFVDEEGLKKKKNPYLEVVAGFNGGPNVMRSNDVLIVKAKVGV